MDLNFNSKLEEYYQKFIELQEKLKKSEEERFMLEMKFNEMVHVAKEEEQAYFRKLRAQYKRFLEEDQKRQERNERIIRNLERIETKIAMLSAKTDRINMFRRQYQNYLRRISNQNRERKISDSRISRERSFIKEEPLKEQQTTMFRDEYSLPERPKGIVDLEKPIFSHPSVKNALEKDRSNEEKIEILDRYLQSIASQRCRDAMNQEREVKEKLPLDMQADKFYKDNFQSSSSNHATSAADDIMNSIYSRYYTKGELLPKGNIFNSQKEVELSKKDEKASEYVKKELHNQYLNPLIKQDENLKFGQYKQAVGLEDEHDVLKAKDDKATKPIDNFKTVEDIDTSFNDQYKENQSNLSQNTEDKQHISKHSPKSGISEKVIEDYKNKQNIDYIDPIQEADSLGTGENYLITGIARGEKVIQHINGKDTQNEGHHENINNEARGLQNEDVNKINGTNSPSEYLEKTRETTAISEIVPTKEQNIIKEDHLEEGLQLEHESHQKQLSNNQLHGQSVQHIPNEQQSQQSEYETGNQIQQSVPEEVKYEENIEPALENQDQSSLKYDPNDIKFDDQPLQDDQNKNKAQSQEPINYDENGQLIQNDKNDQLYQQNQYEERDPTQNDHNQPSEQYNQCDKESVEYGESSQPIQYDQNSQPLYDQTQHDEKAQSIHYSQDQLPEQYNQNATEPVHYDGTEPTIQYAENDQSYQQIQYDENGQPIGYDQYGQPLLYDQNGQVVQPQYDENGQIIPQYDENGQMIILYDQNGQQYFGDQQQYDANGQPVTQYDENGQPIYDQNQQQYYDYSNQEHTDYQTTQYDQYQGVDQEQYAGMKESQLNDYVENIGDEDKIEGGDVGDSNTENLQINNHIENTSITDQHQMNESNLHQAGNDQGDEVIGSLQSMTEKSDSNLNEENKIDEKNETPKPTNVMDILDTDTESAKQNTSKISNDSDFNFS